MRLCLAQGYSGRGRGTRQEQRNAEMWEEGENAIYNVYFMKNNFVPTGSEEAIKELL